MPSCGSLYAWPRSPKNVPLGKDVICKYFKNRRLHAVDTVSLQIPRGSGSVLIFIGTCFCQEGGLFSTSLLSLYGPRMLLCEVGGGGGAVSVSIYLCVVFISSKDDNILAQQNSRHRFLYTHSYFLIKNKMK